MGDNSNCYFYETDQAGEFNISVEGDGSTTIHCEPYAWDGWTPLASHPLVVIGGAISGPSDLPYYCSGGAPPIQLTVPEQADGVNIDWAVEVGSDKAYCSPDTGTYTYVYGTAPSTAENDVTIKATFNDGQTCEATKTLTVRRPESAAVVSEAWYYYAPPGWPCYPPFHYAKKYTYQVYDQLGHTWVFAGTPVIESFTDIDTEHPCPAVPDAYQTATDSTGQFSDVIGLCEPRPPDYYCHVLQTIKVGGCRVRCNEIEYFLTYYTIDNVQCPSG